MNEEEPVGESDFAKEISRYRTTLQELEQKMQSEYDKAVATLSGGALGLSFVFLRDVVKAAPLKSSDWLVTAWVAWGLSIVCVLYSFLSSVHALRKAIRQTDAKTIYVEKAGGASEVATVVLNYSGGVLFLLGVVCVIVFMRSNMP